MGKKECLKQQCSVGSQCYIDSNNIDLENYKVPVVLSDESKVLRFSFENGLYELILEHSDGAIDLKRADILPLLVQHNSEELPIGTFEDIRLEDKKLKATAIFDDEDEMAMKVFKKVSKGIMKSLSVGINVNKKVPIKGQKNVFKATSWELQECSFVTIPAIPTAKVGLSELNLQMEGKEMTKEQLQNEHHNIYDEILKDGATKEAQRIQEILKSVPEHYQKNETLQEMIFDGKSDVRDIKAALYDLEQKQKEQMNESITTDAQNLANQVQQITDTNQQNNEDNQDQQLSNSVDGAIAKLNERRGK